MIDYPENEYQSLTIKCGLIDKKYQRQMWKRQLKFDFLPQHQKEFQETVLNACRIPQKKKQGIGGINQFQNMINPALEPLKSRVGMIVKRFGKKALVIGSAIILSPMIVLTCAHCIIKELNQDDLQIKRMYVDKWKKNVQQYQDKQIELFQVYFPKSQEAKLIREQQNISTKQAIIGKSDYCYKVQNIKISQKLLNYDFDSDWALLLLQRPNNINKNIKITKEQLKKRLKIVVSDLQPPSSMKNEEGQTRPEYQSSITAYYVGFYLTQIKSQDRPHLYSPSYSFNYLTINQKQIQHQIQTVSGSSGGALIYCLQVGRNQFRYYLVGVHRCCCNGKLKKGAILDKDFKDKYEGWMKQYDPTFNPLNPDSSVNQLISLKKFHQTVGKFSRYSLTSVLQNDKQCKSLVDLLKFSVKLSNRYLFFIFKWVKQEQELYEKQQKVEWQKQFQLSNSKLEEIDEFYEDIRLIANQQFQFADFSFGKIPLNYILNQLEDNEDLDNNISQKITNSIRHAAYSLQQFLTKLQEMMPEQHNQAKYFLRQLITFISPIKHPTSQTLYFMQILFKLLAQFSMKSITKILKDYRNNIANEFSGKNVVKQTINKMRFHHRVFDFMIKNNSLNRIQSIAFLLKHQYAQKNKIVYFDSLVAQQYTEIYRKGLNAWIQKNAGLKNILFELQRTSLTPFACKGQYKQEQYKLNIIMLEVFKQYYNGGNKFDVDDLITKSTSDFLEQIIQSIRLAIKRQIISLIVSKLLLPLQEAKNIELVFYNELRRQFIDHCLLLHYEYNLACKSTTFSTVNFKIIQKDLTKWQKTLISTLSLINQKQQQINQINIQIKNKKRLRQKFEKLDSKIAFQQLKKEQQQLQQEHIKEQDKLRSLKIQYSETNLQIKKLELAEKYQHAQMNWFHKHDQVQLHKASPKKKMLRFELSENQQLYQKLQILKSSKKIKPEKKPYSKNQTLIHHNHLNRLHKNDTDNDIYYNHIGVIRIKNEELSNQNEDKYESNGTGTLVGRQAVLTAYHVISPFIKYKKFIKGHIKFQLRGRDHKNKSSNILRIRCSEQFDWALLFLQDQSLFKQGEYPKFTLITHNSNTEVSFLVGKYYFCQIVGFALRDKKDEEDERDPFEIPQGGLDYQQDKIDTKQQQEFLSRSQGHIFIKEQYSHSLKYALSTTQKMSGSPIIIYPTGKYGGPNGQDSQPYILGIHVEGFDQQSFRMINNGYFQEKYNYGNKVIKEVLDKNLTNTKTAYKCEQIDQNLFPYQTVHQNSYLFSRYFYQKGKSVLISNYYDDKSANDAEVQKLFFDDFKNFAKCGIIFQDMDYENIFCYLNQDRDKNIRQFIHRIFNANISLIQDINQAEDEIAHNSWKLFQMIVVDYYKKRQANYILQGFDKRLKKTTTQQLPMNRQHIIKCLSLQKIQDLKQVLNHYESILYQPQQLRIISQPQKLAFNIKQQEQAQMISSDSIDLAPTNDTPITQGQSQISQNHSQGQPKKTESVKMHIFQSYYYKQLVQDRQKLFKLKQQLDTYEKKVEPSTKQQIKCKIQRLSQLIQLQIVNEIKIQFDGNIQKYQIHYFRSQRKAQNILDYLKAVQNIMKPEEKIFLLKMKFKKGIKQQRKVEFQAKVDNKFQQFMDVYYNNLYQLHTKCQQIDITNINVQLEPKLFIFLDNVIKLLILKCTDQIRALFDLFLQSIIPFRHTKSIKQYDWLSGFKLPIKKQKIGYDIYVEDLKYRAERLQKIETLEQIENRNYYIASIMNYSFVRQVYLQKYQQTLKVMAQKKVQFNKQQKKRKQSKLNQQQKQKKISENRIAKLLADTYGFPKKQSLLNVSRIILEQISLFSLLNYDQQQDKIIPNQYVNFRRWDQILKILKVIEIKQNQKRRKTKKIFEQQVQKQDNEDQSISFHGGEQ